MQELKNKIIACAHLHFLRGGIKWLDLDHIANDCGVSRKTLRHCFKRNELIDALIKSKLETYQQSLAVIELDQLEPLEEMTKILSFITQLGCDFSPIFLRDLKRYFPENWALMASFSTGSLKKVFMGNLTAGIQKGIYRKAIHVELLTDVYFTTTLALIERESLPFQSGSSNKSILEMNENFIAGLRSYSHLLTRSTNKVLPFRRR